MKLINLGIQVYQSTISDDFYNYLLGQIDTIDLNNKRIQNENFVGGGDYTLINQSNSRQFESFVFEHSKQYTTMMGLYLKDLWVNVQAHDDFFPLHQHDGVVSFVIYVKVPEYLNNYPSNGQYNNVSYAEGSIQFQYGNTTRLYSPALNIKPVERMILMFPSEVQHYVYPFRNREAKRISVSGNLAL